MMRIRSVLPIVLSLVTFLPAATCVGAAGGDGTREWRFTALLDGKKIGYQTFRLTESGQDRVLVSEARYKVKILFVNVYSYHHDDREEWRGDCLTRIESKTNDNGEQLFVHGELAQAHLVVDTGEGRQRLPECVETFAYWNPHILDATRLLNSQTGKYVNVKVTSQGRETIEAGGRQRAADHYTLTTDEFSIDLWYSPERRWLGLETTTESGRRLRYLLN